jgi:phosphate transport system substrate-binding protein
VTSATFIVLYKDQAKPENGRTTVGFFDWAFEKGAKTAADMDYVPLPKDVTDKIRASWRAELKADGKPLLK